MKLKNILAVALSAVMVTGALAGCGSKTKSESLETINLTYVKSPLNVPSIIEKNKGLLAEEFKAENTAVNYFEITSGPEQTQALAAGELDFLHAVGGTSVILAAAEGVDIKILNVYSRGGKGFMILTNDEDIQSAADLAGKTVGGPKGTVLHQLLITALASEGVSQDDVEFIAMSIPDATAALSNGSIDAALIAGPTALQAINSGAKIVTTGEGLVDGTIVTAVSTKFYEAYPEVVARFLKVENEVLAWMDANEEEMLAITGEEVGLTLDETKEMYSWYDFNNKITESDIEELEKTQDFLINNGLQENRIEINNLILNLK